LQGTSSRGGQSGADEQMFRRWTARGKVLLRTCRLPLRRRGLKLKEWDVSVQRTIGAVVLMLALLAGLLMSVGTIKAKDRGGQAVFVAGWSLVLISSLMLVQQY
jgi:hypothetical protein